ncbi:MAG: hypothetical protein CSA49_03170 [Gammaproteobacteria bacterium]|nr:MAG: hypothetical protein CSA49_03170 [Gammaproteobacteria bacterium]
MLLLQNVRWLKKALSVFVVVVTTCLSGCGEVGLYVCIAGNGPVFQTKSLPDAVLNQHYQADIQVEIENEPQDDWFFYDFSVEDNLPYGLEAYHFNDSRVLSIEGTPTETGIFRFDVLVQVSGVHNLCYYRARREFVLVVNEI